ncbi:LOW QUALITY PROTEIN: pro-neuregulin-3, membrane-bound isoform [Eucyclogobius newberryi]|uniref:LOW QUALITY PROTEIN: pro-neuregulin-3, membrane-bound isoform n=1 Tax=Eucyclogobius newberryi TaxID=166745 RepID=UPI003B5CED8C
MPLHHPATCLTSIHTQRQKKQQPPSPDRMSERSGTSSLVPMTLEEPGAEQASPRAQGPLRCGPCAVWPRQQTWLCAVPLVMGFVGLGLSLMLLKWIVVGSVQDYVPTDLVDPKGSIGQDPIFLSKPSAMPKGQDIPATTTTSAASTTAILSTTTLLAADGTAPAPRTRSGPPANHSANGSSLGGEGNHAPHLHNRVGTRIIGTVVTASTTRATRLTPPPSAKEVTPRNAVRKGIGNNGRNGPVNSKPGQTVTVTSTSSSTVTPAVKTTAKLPLPSSQPAVPFKPTTRWNHGRPGKGPATRPHHRYRTPVAPTLPSIRSEVFKPCVEDKDLAFCLNEGECSIIETVAGVHRHCRCKEGYHGLRCDQFVPKTDAILSDPTDELGIEFMESGDTYQRQVLSIFSIASGIGLLGVACMALYRRNKRHREKLQAHFSDSRSLRDCSVNASALMSKSTKPLYHQPLQKPSAHGAGVKASEAGTSPPAFLSRVQSKSKRFRSSSLSLSPAQQRRESGGYFCTPPVPRGRPKLSTGLMEGARVTGNSYRHLQEDDAADMESVRRCEGSGGGRVGTLLSRTSLSHFTIRKGWTEVPCTHLDRAGIFLPPSLRTRSVPIIPSLQAGDPNQSPIGKISTTTVTDYASSTPYETFVPETSANSGRYVSAAVTVGSAMELRRDLDQENVDTHNETGKREMQNPSTGLKATGQRGVQEPCQGQTNLESGSANCSLATAAATATLSCRAAGNGSARPSAS